MNYVVDGRDEGTCHSAQQQCDSLMCSLFDNNGHKRTRMDVLYLMIGSVHCWFVNTNENHLVLYFLLQRRLKLYFGKWGD